MFQFLHILRNAYCLFYFVLAILVCLKWYLTVVLFCISLMTNDVEHLFVCLAPICIAFSALCFVTYLIISRAFTLVPF